MRMRGIYENTVYGKIWEYSGEIPGKIEVQKELPWNLPSGYVKIAIEDCH